jgi:hypothetical protein
VCGLLGYDALFDSRQGQEMFLYRTASRPALGPTQPSIQWIPAVLPMGKEAGA